MTEVDLVAALLSTGLARDWRDAFGMPADLADALLASVADLRRPGPAAAAAAAAGPAAGPRVVRRADGSAEMRFGSLDQLTALLPRATAAATTTATTTTATTTTDAPPSTDR